MNIAQALTSAGFDRSDAEILLAALMKRGRAFLLAHPDHALTASEEVVWLAWSERRKTGEPVSYIIGEKEFYGRTFSVDGRVHIPRPSTENLVSMTLDFLNDPKDEVRALEPGIIGVSKLLQDCSAVNTVVDVGTGSGCIAITVALERPDLRVIGIDISGDALDVAKENAARLGATVEFLRGDLLSPVAHLKEPFIVVSNPPYLNEDDVSRNIDLAYEPRNAFIGGTTRNALIERLEKNCFDHALCSALIIEQTAHPESDSPNDAA